MHLFGFTSEEATLLTPGDEVVTAKTALGCVGISTCYDLRFPELYRKQAVAGAELFLVASGWPYPRETRTPQPTRISSHPWGLTMTWSGSRTTTVVVGDSKIADPLISAPGGSASRS